MFPGRRICGFLLVFFCFSGCLPALRASNLPDAPVLTQTAADTVTVERNALDGNEITHFRIVETVGIDLFQNDGATPLEVGEFLTVTQGSDGLKFIPQSGAGETSLTVVAALAADPDATGSASTTIDLSPGSGTPEFNLSRTDYTAWEGTRLPVDISGTTIPAMIIEIEKSGGGAGSWSVEVEVLQDLGDGDDATPDDANPDNGVDDFVVPDLAERTVIFSGSESRKALIIPLIDDTLAEDNERFTVRLTNPQKVTGSDMPSLGAQIEAKVVIIDNLWEEEDLTSIAPGNPPATTGAIDVTLNPGAANGQWRLVGESAWRGSGTQATGLAAGIYGIEFKPVPGYDAPLPVSVDVTEGNTLFHAGTYAANPGQETGDLLVNLTGPPEVRWRRVGETIWNNGGYTESGVIAGDWVVEFQPVTGYATPIARSVTIIDGETTTLDADYQSGASFGDQPMVIDYPTLRDNDPYRFVGQIQTPLGSGTGTVVKEKVVLTAAHVLFDDHAYTWQGNVRWRFQRHAGSHEPAPETPRGWYVFDEGYSAAFVTQRRVEGTPGLSSLKAHDLDVAAMFFLADAGRGGKSGFLVKNGAGNAYLTDAGRSRVLVGYPLEGVLAADQGKPHEVGPATDIDFTHAVALANGHVFTSTDWQMYPGASGGPLFVEKTVGAGDYYPAAVFVGGTGETRVRAIDNLAADLIALANGDRSSGGGIDTGAPTDITISSNSILENEPVGSVVGVLGAVDRDQGDAFTFSIVGGEDAFDFSISGSDLLTAKVFDWESQQVYRIRVRVVDSGANVFEKDIEVDALDDKSEDFDGDGLTQLEEEGIGTSDLDWDFDDDGAGDGVEHSAGTDPADGADFPDGTVYAWGDDGWGQVSMPPTLGGARMVAAGSHSSIALLYDGTVVAWGNQGNGIPMTPTGLDEVIKIDGQRSHALALTRDGAVHFWGTGSWDVIEEVPADLDDAIDVAAGGSHNLAVRSDGTVLAWGLNTDGQIDVPVGLNGVVAVAAGYSHSLALKSDGTVVAWGGLNLNGQISVPDGLENVIAIAARSNASMALKADGTVTSWGAINEFGGLSDVKSIACGGTHYLVAKNDRTAIGISAGAVPPGIGDVEGVATGWSHSLVLRSKNLAPEFAKKQNELELHAEVGVAFVHQLDVSGSGLGFESTSLPSGLTLNSSTGEITGVPNEAGLTFCRVVVKNSAGQASIVVPIRATEGDPPTDITLSSSTVLENAPVGTVVGTLGATDPDAGDSFTYSIAGGEDAFDFMIAGSELQTARSLDWESQRFYRVLIRVVDSGANTYEEEFVIEALDDKSEDFDGDGLTQLEEEGIGTSDLDWDFDDDGAGDGVENAAGTAPDDATDYPDGVVLAWRNYFYFPETVPPTLGNVQMVAAGRGQFVALHVDGTVTGWGNDVGGEATPPPGLSGVVKIDSGSSFSLALKVDGSLAGWGFYSIPSGLDDVVDIAVGDNHNLALDCDGLVIAWGSNFRGQTDVPPGLNNVVGVAAGRDHSLALRRDGTVVAWGDNDNGQSTVPPGLSDVVEIRAGGDTSVAVKGDGTVVSWGVDIVADGLSDVRSVSCGDTIFLARISDRTAVGSGGALGAAGAPIGVEGVEDVAVGGEHALVLRSKNPAPRFAARQNELALQAAVGQPASIPLEVSGAGLQFEAVQLPEGLAINAATGEITGTPTVIGSSFCRIIAKNSAGQESRVVPFAVTDGEPPTDITLTSSSVPENEPAGTVVGELGAIDPDQGETFTYSIVGGEDSFAFEISGTELRTAQILDRESQEFYEVRIRVVDSKANAFDEVFLIEALDDNQEDFDGDGLTQLEEEGIGTSDLDWDFDDDGAGDGVEHSAGTDPDDGSDFPDGTVVAWGDNYFGQSTVPPTLADVQMVAAGSDHSLALHHDGTVTAWGFDFHGSLAPPQGLGGVVKITGGSNQSLALKSDGTVVFWGSDDGDQEAIASSLSKIVDIASGSFHSLAVRSDGTVVAWGYNSEGQTDVPDGLNDVVAVAGGSRHSVALKRDGTVVAWGYDSSGQASVPEGLNNVIAISAGGSSSMALKGDGTIEVWGSVSIPDGLTGMRSVACESWHFIGGKDDRTGVGQGGIYGEGTIPPGIDGIEGVTVGRSYSMVLRSKNFAPRFAEKQNELELHAALGKPFQVQLEVSGDNLEFESICLPSGLNLDSATGEISGVPNEIGLTFCRVIARNSAGQSSIVVPFLVTTFFPHTPTLTRSSPTTFTLARNSRNGEEITHFRILDIEGVTLTLSDGTTPVGIGDWITAAEGVAGLQFTAIPGATNQTVTVASAVTGSEGGTGSATSTIDLNPTSGTVTFSLGAGAYTASEGDLLTVTGSSVSALVLDILKSGTGTGQSSVDVELIPGTATADDNNLGNGLEDYREPAVATVTFNASDAARGFYVELVDDEVAEFEESFTVRLVNPTNSAVLGAIREAIVTIIDDEQAVSELTRVDPGPITGGESATLQVHLAPEDANGKWRLLTESLWRDSGDRIDGLAPGNYAVEFRPVSGHTAPLPITVPIEAGSRVVPLIEFYRPDPGPVSTGSLTVNLAGDTGRWRLRGEKGNSWNSPGFTESGLLPGIYGLEFESIAGHDAPVPRQVQIVGGQGLTVDEGYTAEPAFGSFTVQPLTLSQVTSEAPYQWNGQVQTVLGNASGVVVSEHVVLTAASALYDDANYRYLSGVQWQFQRHGSEHNPLPQTPRGWQVIGQGYAAEFDKQREVERSPGSYSLRSRELDVAAMVFLTSPGRGGSGGYLVDNTSSNPWLTDAGRGRLVAGYPSDVALPDQDKLHATTSSTGLVFTHVRGPVFSTTGFRDRPGMAGAPVYARNENGHDYPAAIVLGGTNETLVRAIDNSVAFLIGQAEILGDTGQDGQGEGNIPHVTVERLATGEVFVDSNLTSASWQLRSEPDGTVSRVFPTKTGFRSGAGDFSVLFSDEPDWAKPDDEALSLDEAEGANLFARYVIDSPGGTSLTLGQWRAQFGVNDLFHDGDGDGITPLEEFAYNLRPDRPDAGVMAAEGGSGLPRISIIENAGAWRIRVEFLRRKNAGLTYSVEFRNSLGDGSWIAAVGADNVVDLGDDWERVTIEDTVTVDEAATRFGRVRLEEAP